MKINVASVHGISPGNWRGLERHNYRKRRYLFTLCHHCEIFLSGKDGLEAIATEHDVAHGCGDKGAHSYINTTRLPHLWTIIIENRDPLTPK